jgi:hypothetical protein
MYCDTWYQVLLICIFSFFVFHCSVTILRYISSIFLFLYPIHSTLFVNIKMQLLKILAFSINHCVFRSIFRKIPALYSTAFLRSHKNMSPFFTKHPSPQYKKNVSRYFCSKQLPALFLIFPPFFSGISVCGSGVGTFIFAPLASYLVETFGWKGANLIFAALCLQCAVRA